MLIRRTLNQRVLASLFIFCLVIESNFLSTSAAIITWDGNLGNPPHGNFNTAANWNPNQVPGVGDIARFSVGSAYTVLMPAFPAEAVSDVVEVLSGVVTFQNGSIQPSTYRVETGEAALKVRGGGMVVRGGQNVMDLRIGGALLIGDSGASGQVIVAESGGLKVGLNPGNDISRIGFSGHAGNLTFRNGSAGLINGFFEDPIHLGVSALSASHGSMNVETGAQVIADDINIATNTSAATGSLEITGTNSWLRVINITLGSSTGGAGTILVDDGVLESQFSVDVNATGLIDITGSGSFDIGSNLSVNGGTINANGSGENGGLTLSTTSELIATNGASVNYGGDVGFFGLPAEVEFLSGADLNAAGRLRVHGTPFMVDGFGSSVTTAPGSLSLIGPGIFFLPDHSTNVTFRNDAIGNLGAVDVANPDEGEESVLAVESGAQVSTMDVTIGADGFGLNYTGSSHVVVHGIGSTLSLSGDSVLTLGNASFGEASLSILKGGGVITGTGPVTLEPTATLRIDGGHLNLLGPLVDNGGTIEFVAGELFVANDFILGDGGWKVSNLEIGPSQFFQVGGQLTIDPYTLVTLAGGDLVVDELDVRGTFDFQSGRLAFSGLGLLVGGGGPFHRSLIIEDEQTILVFNQLQIDPDANVLVEPGGKLEASTIANDGEIQLGGGSARIATTVFANNGTLGGSGRIDGTLINNLGAEVFVTFGEQIRVTGGTNINEGHITLAGGSIAYGDLSNLEQGLVIGNGTLRTDAGLNNSGTMALSATTNILGNVANNITGLITSSGGTTTFFDDITNNGEIRTNQNSFTVYFGSYSGNGDTGTGTVIMEGDLKPGFSPGTMEFGGDLILGPDASIEIEINGPVAGVDYDKIIIGGTGTLNGSLGIILGDFIPSPADSFGFLVADSFVGTFSNVSVDSRVATTDGTGTFLVSFDAHSNAWHLSDFVTIGVPGDYNQNGIVDAADYVLFRKHEGTTYTLANDPIGGVLGQAQYDQWVAHFGQTTGSGSLSSAKVPEPATWTLVILAAAVNLVSRRRFVKCLATLSGPDARQLGHRVND